VKRVSKLISKISPNSLNSANRSVFSWIVRPAVIILYPRRNAWWVKNLANIISTTRLPVSLAVVCYQVYPGYVARDYHRLYVGLAVMLVLLLSDGVDGALARGLLAVSRYGKAIDPLADKVFYLSSLIAMLILLIPALYYELRLVITALVTEKVCRKRQTVEPVGANTWGKTKFGLQALAIFLGLGLPWPTLGFSCAMILVAVSLPLAHLSLRGHQIDLESIRLKPCA
jgi:phosphatidylglycerophosphate synthase